jgi:succinate dehydrogenase / fumarate reductase cytochrome b subunit
VKNQPSLTHFLRWFDLRRRGAGTFAFALNRVTAIGLVFYLFLHLVMLGKLAQGQEAYDEFIALARHPLIQAGELLVIAAGVLHGLNGVRIMLTTFGIGTNRQRGLFYALMAPAVFIILYFVYRMFLVE